MAQKTGLPTRRDALHSTTEPAPSCPSTEDEGKAAPTLRPASSDHPAQTPASSMHNKQPETPGGVEGAETPHFLGDLEHTLSRPQMMGWEAETGDTQEKGKVRKTLGTPGTLAPSGPGGTIPFSCQHFPVGAKSERLFPRKIRKALKFSIYVGDFLAGLHLLPLPPPLNSCFETPHKQGSQQPKRIFTTVSPKDKSPYSVNPGIVTCPSKKQVVLTTNFLRPQRAQLPGSYHKTGALSAQVSSGMELQLEPSKGNHLPRHWCGVGHQPHHQLLPSLIHILHLSKSSRSAASRPGPYPATLDWTRPLKLFPHRCSRDATDGGMPANSGFLGQEGPPSCVDLLALSSDVSHARTVPEKRDPKVTPRPWETYKTTHQEPDIQDSAGGGFLREAAGTPEIQDT